MRYASSFLDRPVYSLQTMLRQIAALDAQILPNIPNGAYTESTKASVKSFQQAYDLPANGNVSLPVWDQIVSAYNRSLPLLLPPVCPLLRFPLPIKPGAFNEHLRLAQAMLLSLSSYFSELNAPAVSGILDETTERGLRWIQAAADLPVNGILDVDTWNRLSHVYRLMIGDGSKRTDFG